MSRRREMALAQQCKHLRGGNVSHPKHEVVLAQELLGLMQNSDRARHIALSKPQAGEKHRIRGECIYTFSLPRQLEALLPVLLGSIEVVPFVVDTRQA